MRHIEYYYKVGTWLERVLLRSWVQIPPGPFLSVVQLRYWFEFIFGYGRTKALAMLALETPYISGNVFSSI